MNYKNISDKDINLKLKGQWTTIQPSIIIELPEYIAMKEKGLIQIKETKQEEKQEIKPIKDDVKDKKVKKVLKKKSKKKVKK